MKRKLIKNVILILLSGLIVLVNFLEISTHPDKQSGIISWGESIGWSIDENNHTNGTKITYDFRSGVEEEYQTITIDGAAKWSDLNIMRTSLSPVGEVYTYLDENSYTVAAFCNYSSDSDGHLTIWKIKINIAKNPTEVTMAHEFGHVAGLNDLYDEENNKDKLMYGIEDRTASGPTSSDIKGVKVITGQHTDHNFSQWQQYDSNTHRKYCIECDGYVSCNHDYEWNYNTLQHWKECTGCSHEKNHENHNMSSWENNGPDGEIKYCLSYCEYYELRGHAFTEYWKYGQPPTCIYPGIRVYDCQTCIYEYEEVYSPLGHTYTDVCDDTCDRCSYTRTPPHMWTSDCDEYCDFCFYHRTPLASHVHVFDYYSPIHPHYAWYICMYCQDRYLSDYEQQSWGTYWTNWYILNQPTCTQTGKEARDLKCNVCHAWLDDEERTIPALGHDWEWVTYSSYKNSSTCPYIINWEDQKCQRCGIWAWNDRYYYTWDGHDWGSWYLYRTYYDPITGEMVDEWRRECYTCGEIEIDEVRY